MAEVTRGTLTKRDGADIEVTTRFGRVIPLAKAKELFPHGFKSRATQGGFVVLFDGGDVRSPLLLSLGDQSFGPDLEDDDAASFAPVKGGGWVAYRSDGTVELDGKSAGGVVLAKELKAQLDKTNAVLQALVAVLAGAPIVEAGNGAISALQVALKTAVAGKTLGDFSAIESEKVLHGDGSA